MRLKTFAMGMAIAGGLLGGTHLALTPLAYPDWTIDALWFVGSGLAIVMAAAANITDYQSMGLRSQMLVTAVNLVMSGFFAAAWLVLPAPQVIVGGALFLGLAGCSLASAFANHAPLAPPA